MEAMAPVVQTGPKQFQYCASPLHTTNQAGSLLCLECRVTEENNVYSKSCNPLFCNALVESACRQSPVCTYSAGGCQFKDADICAPRRLVDIDNGERVIVALESDVRPDLNMAISVTGQNMLCEHQLKYISRVLLRHTATGQTEAYVRSDVSLTFEDVDPTGASPTASAPPSPPTPPPPTLFCADVDDPAACVQQEGCNWYGQLNMCQTEDYVIPRLKEQVQLNDELSDLYLTLFIVTVSVSGLCSVLHSYDVWRLCRNRRSQGTEAVFASSNVGGEKGAVNPPAYTKSLSAKSLL